MSGRFHERDEEADLATGESALRWALAQGNAARIAEHSRAQRRKKQRARRLLAGSAIAMALVAGTLFWQGRVAPSSLAAGMHSAIISAPARETLSDGTLVELRSGAKMTVDFAADARRVRLLAGEAHFTVAENKLVPFIVVAGGIEVRAVGTAFAVEIGAKRVEVLVTEGCVAVDRPAATALANGASGIRGPAPTPATIAMVDAGKALAVESETGAVTSLALSAAEQGERLAWRAPRLELSGTPLSEALAVFNRYGRVRVELADAELGALKLSGVMRPDSLNALLHVLKVDYGLVAEQRADGTLLLRRR